MKRTAKNRFAKERFAKHLRIRRASLLLDAQLLSEAMRVLRAESRSATVNLALAEVLRVRRIQQIPSFFGEGLWEGSLKEMRDKPARARAIAARRIGHRRLFR